MPSTLETLETNLGITQAKIKESVATKLSSIMTGVSSSEIAEMVNSLSTDTPIYKDTRATLLEIKYNSNLLISLNNLVISDNSNAALFEYLLKFLSCKLLVDSYVSGIALDSNVSDLVSNYVLSL